MSLTASQQLTIIDPTALQRAASDPTASVWVNASAGSGKTTILTNRVVRLLLAGVSPHKILCLTFTRAAAAEMSLRVMDKLSHWAVCSDNDLNVSLGDLQGRAPTPKEMTKARRLFAEALACPGGMRIRTLHAFGQEILRRFPIESNLPPHFRVIEEDDASNLKNDVLNELLRETSAQPNTPTAKAITHLIATLGEKGFHEAVRNLLHDKARITNAMTKYGNLEAVIGRVRSTLDLQPDDTEDSIIRAAFTTEQLPESAVREAAKLLLHGTPSVVKRGEAILLWLEKNHEERVASHRNYIKFFLTNDGTISKQFAGKALLDKNPDLHRFVQREGTRLISLAERCDAVKVTETTAASLVFGVALNARYSHAKRQQAALDYDDLVNETLNLLQRPGIAPWVLHKLDDGLDHLLVDEAQDTSRAQWNIVATLAEEFFAGSTAHNTNRTLFVVGDEKQSIYSFQNADPEAFATMRDFFKKKIMAAEKKWEEIPLHVSFRSAPAVLRAVDAVFDHPAAVAGVSTARVEHISFKRDKIFGRVECWPLILQPEKDKSQISVWDLPLGYESERDPQAELAEHIAATIKGWIANGAILPGTDRVIRPADIMILLRRRGRFADLMVRALKQEPHAVPVTGVDRMRLMEQLPVMDLLALIQFTLLPEDDLNLACVLRSPLLNLSEDDLLQLAVQREGVSLWQRVKSASAPHIITAQNYLATWLGKADFETPFSMLTHILNEPCPASTTSGRHALWKRLGLDALDPIDELLNAAQNFNRRHTPSLQGFLHWLTASDSEIKRELDSGKTDAVGQVRIMTVHASKGLEAPIVFLPDTANMPRAVDVPKLLWNETQELPFYLATKPDAGFARRIWNQAREKQLQEYRRLLYVAMTRASHRLYVGGWEPTRKEGDDELSWYNLVKTGLKASEPHAQSNGESIVWEDPALRSAQATKLAPLAKVIPLPAWALKPAPAELPPEKSIAPSQQAVMPSATTPDLAFARGRIIHRLLQSLPDVEATRRDAAAQRFLAHPQHNLTDEQQNEVRDEVMKIVTHPDFAPLFGSASRAEVPLAGLVNGRKISGQVDRLALIDGDVWIVDYKTNRPPPTDATAIPEIYRLQMESYREVLQAIYPARAVRCFLLWTYGPRLMELPIKQA